jgi:quinol monooxygenase YgiN
MIVEYLRYAIDPDRAEAFIADYEAASAPLLASPWCLSFDLCRCVEEPSSFILRIEWTSAEDHLGKFRGSPEFRAFFAKIRPYLSDIAEMRHYERLLSASEAPEAIG